MPTETTIIKNALGFFICHPLYFLFSSTYRDAIKH